MKKRKNSRFTFVSNKFLSRSKRSQATIFIILAIVIVGAIAGGAYVVTKNNASEEYFSQASIKLTADIIRSEIVDCAEDTSKQALETIGVQGGYYKKPREYSQLDTVFVPYYYKEGELLSPPKSTIETQLSLYVNENLDNCLEQLNYEGFEIIYKTPRTQSSIKEKEVIFNINLPVKLKKEGNSITYELKDRPISINSELNAILGVADFITESHKQDPAMYCISCVGQLAENDNLYVDIVNFRENEMLIIISENHTSSEPYSFEFLNKYTGNEVSPLEELAETPQPPLESKQ